MIPQHFLQLLILHSSLTQRVLLEYRQTASQEDSQFCTTNRKGRGPFFTTMRCQIAQMIPYFKEVFEFKKAKDENL